MVTGREASLGISLSLAKRHRGSWMPTYSFSMRHNNCPTGLCLCYRFSILYQIDCDVTPPILDISVFVCKVISSSPFENNRLHTHTDVVSSYKLSCFCRIRRYISCAPLCFTMTLQGFSSRGDVSIHWYLLRRRITLTSLTKQNMNSVVVWDLKFQMVLSGEKTAAHLPNTWRQWWSKTGEVHNFCSTKEFFHQSIGNGSIHHLYMMFKLKWLETPCIQDWTKQFIPV